MFSRSLMFISAPLQTVSILRAHSTHQSLTIAWWNRWVTLALSEAVFLFTFP